MITIKNASAKHKYKVDSRSLPQMLGDLLFPVIIQYKKFELITYTKLLLNL